MRRMTSRGLTLVELMVVVAIVALMAAAAGPPVFDYIENARLRESASRAMADVLFAQGESLKRNATVKMSVLGPVVRVTDSVQTPVLVLREQTLPEGVRPVGDTLMSFGSGGQPVPWGTEYSLQFRTAASDCGGRHRCPVLKVFAGGGIRLCADAGSCV